MNPNLIKVTKRMDNGNRLIAGVRKSQLAHYKSKGWSVDKPKKEKKKLYSDSNKA